MSTCKSIPCMLALTRLTSYATRPIGVVREDIFIASKTSTPDMTPLVTPRSCMVMAVRYRAKGSR